MKPLLASTPPRGPCPTRGRTWRCAAVAADAVTRGPSAVLPTLSRLCLLPALMDPAAGSKAVLWNAHDARSCGRALVSSQWEPRRPRQHPGASLETGPSPSDPAMGSQPSDAWTTACGRPQARDPADPGPHAGPRAARDDTRYLLYTTACWGNLRCVRYENGPAE